MNIASTDPRFQADSSFQPPPVAPPTPFLELHKNYSRRAVHGVFSPDTVFVPQAGNWGLHGIVDIPDRPGDYVFFVTFGQTQGAHKFAEFITEDGVLSWQSQPRQGFNDRRIKDFVSHREELNNIYLFLRTDGQRDYTFLGRLKYLDHDATKEKPVYFQWQILTWPPSADVIRQANLTLKSSLSSIIQNDEQRKPSHTLTFVEPPLGRHRGAASVSNSIRTSARRPDYIANHEANQKLGLLGELLVMRGEKERLNAAGLFELAARVRHVSVAENDMAGYDILSFEVDGSKRFIEVKTTRGSADADFFMSAKELAFSSLNAKRYYLYRLYDYNDEKDMAKCFVLSGDVGGSALLRLVPTTYKVNMTPSEVQI